MENVVCQSPQSFFERSSGGPASPPRLVMEGLFGTNKVPTAFIKAVGLLNRSEIPYRELIELAGSCGRWEWARDITVATFARDMQGRYHWLTYIREYFVDLSFLRAHPEGFFGLALGLFDCAYDLEQENQDFNQTLPEIVSLFICLDLASICNALPDHSSSLNSWDVNSSLKKDTAYHAAISRSIKQYFGVKTSQRLRTAQEILRCSRSLGGVKNQTWGWLLGNLIVDNIAFALMSAMSSSQKASAVLSVSDTFIDAKEGEEREEARKRSQAKLDEREEQIRWRRR